MFSTDEWTQIDIGLYCYIKSEQEYLEELQENLEYENSQKSKDEESIEDYKYSIQKVKNKLSDLDLLQAKVKIYKLGIKK